MSDDEARVLQYARRYLMNDATQAYGIGMSADDWEEEVRYSEYGQLVGLRQIESIWRLVWGT